jgi:hypothetical protein
LALSCQPAQQRGASAQAANFPRETINGTLAAARFACGQTVQVGQILSVGRADDITEDYHRPVATTLSLMTVSFAAHEYVI